MLGMIVSAKGRVARWVWCDSVFLSMAVVSSASIPASHCCLCLTRLQGVGCRCRQGLKGQRAQPRWRRTDVLPAGTEQGEGKATSQRRPLSPGQRAEPDDLSSGVHGVHDECSRACCRGPASVLWGRSATHRQRPYAGKSTHPLRALTPLRGALTNLSPVAQTASVDSVRPASRSACTTVALGPASCLPTRRQSGVPEGLRCFRRYDERGNSRRRASLRRTQCDPHHMLSKGTVLEMQSDGTWMRNDVLQNAGPPHQTAIQYRRGNRRRAPTDPFSTPQLELASVRL